MELTKNFKLEEFIKSDVAVRNNIDNKPSQEVIDNLTALCKNILQPLRDDLKKPVRINSGYRSTALNRFIGGSESSQHCKGQAADIEIDGTSNKHLITYITLSYDYDQIILEFYDEKEGPNSGWIHVSYVSKEKNRKEILTSYKDHEGKTKYKEGII